MNLSKPAIAALLLVAPLAQAASLVADAGEKVTGMVHDSSGAPIADAHVTLMTALQSVVASTRTNTQGKFVFVGIPTGSYVVSVVSPGFSQRRFPITAQPNPAPLVVVLDLMPLEERVTVTADLGTAENPEAAMQPVNIIGEEGIRERAIAVVAQIASEESGVHLQRTSPTIAGIYIRGLTGNKVNVFIDGVRYSTAAMRGGINTFLDLIEPSHLQAVELLRGPNSAQYGSDAIGGSIQLVSRIPAFSASGRRELHGTLDSLFTSGDAGAGTRLTATYSVRNFALLTNLAGRRSSTLRTGGAVDSHAAVTRFLGLRSDALVSGRLPETAFTQYGGMLRMNWAPTELSQIVAHYGRGQIDGGKRYDQLLGGDGNLIADLRNLMADFAYVRYNRFRLGWFDSFTLAWSVNSQREERVNQGGNGNPRSSINHEYERTTVQGIQSQVRRQIGRHQIAAGGDYYHERIHSPSFGVNPVTNVAAIRRGRIPDNARYDGGGFYLQDTCNALANRIRLMGSMRFSAASYHAHASDSPLVGGKALWPDDSLHVSDLTYRAGLVLKVTQGISLFGNASRSFRAPHMTDLGTFGLTGAGFEVAAPDVASLGAFVGSSAGADAVSTGRKVEQVRPESGMSFEGGARYRTNRFATEVAFFANDIRDGITKQALILPPGATGLLLAGQPITSQGTNGVVYVAAATNPVLVRTNYDDARIYGIEHSLDWRVRADLSFGTRFTSLRARDKRTNLPPNIEGGTPAPDGYVKIRYYPGNRRFWLEPSIHAAARQGRLSSLDLEDRRTGAMRSRSSIRSFFLNGASVNGLVGAGTDGIQGTADDLLLRTGETLAQVQDRILELGVQSAPLFDAIPGYVTFGLRAGFRLGERQDVLLDFSNIGDRNYRGISWGLDAVGRSLAVRYRVIW